MNASRMVLPLLLAALASCSGDSRPPLPPAIDGLQTLVVDAGDVAGLRAWEGVVEAVRQATLTAQTSGRVAEVAHDVNDRVAAGEVLVRLSSVEQRSTVQAARARLQAAEASGIEAEGRYRRYMELSRDGYVSALQLEQMRALRDSSVAERDAARAGLANASQQNAYTTIRAPFAGIVNTRDVEPGESVGIGQPLMTLFAPQELRIEVSVPQSDAAAIRADPNASVSLDGRRIDAREVIVFPSADVATHAVRVRVLLPRLDPAPQPGVTARVAFAALKGAPRPRIPASALMRRGEIDAVYVLADGRLSLRQVRLGGSTEAGFEVIAGLQAGETIAADPVAARQALVASRKGP